MRGLRIYIEGGGDGKRQKAVLRRGFQQFLVSLRNAARARHFHWDVILCGGRQAAFDDYRTALQSHSDSVNILLVDAEASVAGGPWQHLDARDGWKDPGVGDRCCHLMVQTVEAWLIADPDALHNYYGHDFLSNSLPATKDVEAIPKSTLVPSLQAASRQTQKGEYAKIRHCADLLAKIAPEKVRSRARHCDRLFREVTRLIE
jgi:Domain of unknown function (DUF4276)